MKHQQHKQHGSLKGHSSKKQDHRQNLATSPEREKGTIEIPEKEQHSHHGNRAVNYIDHLYGLDNDGATSESPSDTASVYETSGFSNSSGSSIISLERDSIQLGVTQTLARWWDQCRCGLVTWCRTNGLIPQARGRGPGRNHRRGHHRKDQHPFYLYLPFLIFLPWLLAWISGVDVANPMSLCQKQSITLQDEELRVLREQTLQLIKDHSVHTDRQSLTREHTEAIVDRILTSKMAELREQLIINDVGSDTWSKWREEQESSMRELTRRYDALWSKLQGVQKSVSSYQLEMNTHKQVLRSETHTQTARLEQRLAALHIELHELQSQHSTVLQQANSSCSPTENIGDTVADILTQVGPIYFKTPRKCEVFGVCCESSEKQVFYLADEGLNPGKGANTVISNVHHYLHTYGFGETNAQFHFDNCSSQNKNNAVLWYALWRVMTGLHHTIEYSLMIAGHTKFSPDMHFGIWKSRWRRVDAETVQALGGGGSTSDTDQESLDQWLHSQYINQADLDQSLHNTASQLTETLTQLVQSNMRRSGTETVGDRETAGLGAQSVSQMISEALLKFDADKVALPDFALESAGGSIIKSRSSPTYHRTSTVIKLFGLPVWYFSNTPRLVLQPHVHAGECWGFEGSTGQLVIRTSHIIVPNGFTLEHLPRAISPTGDIASAPKHFMVYGLQDDQDYMGQWLGNFTYLDNNHPVQHFSCQTRCAGRAFDMFELKILSNHGNLEYTCLYRFRIHGHLYTPNM